MAMLVRHGGATRTITGMVVKQGGVTRTIRRARVQDGGVLRTVAIFAEPLTVTAADVSGSSLLSTVSAGTASAVVTGGLSPFTYAWTLTLSGGGTDSTASSPTSASTNFTKTDVPEDSTISDTWRVTVTDAGGQTAEDSLQATFTNLPSGGGEA